MQKFFNHPVKWNVCKIILCSIWHAASTNICTMSINNPKLEGQVFKTYQSENLQTKLLSHQFLGKSPLSPVTQMMLIYWEHHGETSWDETLSGAIKKLSGNLRMCSLTAPLTSSRDSACLKTHIKPSASTKGNVWLLKNPTLKTVSLLINDHVSLVKDSKFSSKKLNTHQTPKKSI